MRIFALIMAGLLGVANLTMRCRLPPKDIAGGVFHFSALKSPAFSIYCLSAVVCYLGFYTRKERVYLCISSTTLIFSFCFSPVPTFLDISALDAGLSPNFAFYFLAIVNAGSFFGRIATALMIDKIGRSITFKSSLTSGPISHLSGPVNLSVPMTIIAALITYLWPLVHKEGSLVAIAAIYG